MFQAMLEEKCRTFAKETWGMELNIPVKVNGRLKNALGRFYSTRNGNKPIKLEFAKRLQEHNEATINGVVLHELTHWALCSQGKPYDDYHPVFEAEIRRVEAIPTHTIKDTREGFKAYCSKCGICVVHKRLESSLTKYVQNPKVTTKCCKAIVVRNFGDPIQTAKEVLKDKKVYIIIGKPDRGKLILRDRRILVEQEDANVVIGYLLHPHSLMPQKSLVTIEKKYIYK